MAGARPDTWMPLYWGDYVRDTGHLGCAGHGAYLMMIKHYWCTGTPLNDDDSELWRIACCEGKREWLKIRPALERLFLIGDGLWRHKRVEIELAKAVRKTEERRESGSKGAEKRWGSHEISDSLAIAEPLAEPVANGMAKNAPSQSEEEKKEQAALVPKKPAKANRGCRLPENFVPDREFARGLEIPDQRIELEFQRFCDFWRAKPGQSGVKSDWPATWRNWCRKAAEYLGKSAAASNGHDAAWLAECDRACAIFAKSGEWKPHPEAHINVRPGHEHCRIPPEILAKHGLPPTPSADGRAA